MSDPDYSGSFHVCRARRIRDAGGSIVADISQVARMLGWSGSIVANISQVSRMLGWSGSIVANTPQARSAEDVSNDAPVQPPTTLDIYICVV